MTPSQRCESTFGAARDLARKNGFWLENERNHVYILTMPLSAGSIMILTGELMSVSGEPKLNLPRNWTLLDVVVAAVEAKDKAQP